jgi:hypothetical protein
MNLWYPLITKTFFDLSGTRRLGIVVKYNSRTVWVKVMRGANSYDYIKRHIKKHNVISYLRVDKTKGVDDEAIHSTIGNETIPNESLVI